MSLVEDISSLCRDQTEILRILVTSDLNLGYNERNPERCNESFETFEEVLRLSRSERADFVLLGGNLFHQSKPSQKTVNRTLELLNEFCLGDEQPNFGVSSRVQPSLFEKVNFTTANFENPKLNVSLPIFSIYGNHDDTAGACRLLETCGLVNFFGRITDFNRIDLVPIFIVKNSTTIGLFGLSNLPDRNLLEALRQQKVSIYKSSNDWLNLLTLHQNRSFESRNSSQNRLRAADIPSIFDLTIWGHEHECRPKPDRVANSERFILQPGSTIATSLTKGESVSKHVFILEIYKNFYAIRSHRLTTARCLFYKVLENPIDATEVNHRFIVSKLEDILRKVHAEHTNVQKTPLVKLVVNVRGENRDCDVNLTEIANLFAARISNSANCVNLAFAAVNESSHEYSLRRSERDTLHLLDYVKRYYDTDVGSKKVAVESLKLLSEAVCKCLNDENVHSFETTVNNQVFKSIKSVAADLDEIDLDTFLRADVVRLAVQKHCDQSTVSEDNTALEAQPPQVLQSDDEMETNENQDPEPSVLSTQSRRNVTKRKRSQPVRNYISDSDEYLDSV